MDLSMWGVSGCRRDDLGKTRESQVNKESVGGCMRSAHAMIEQNIRTMRPFVK